MPYFDKYTKMCDGIFRIFKPSTLERKEFVREEWLSGEDTFVVSILVFWSERERFSLGLVSQNYKKNTTVIVPKIFILCEYCSDI